MDLVVFCKGCLLNPNKNIGFKVGHPLADTLDECKKECKALDYCVGLEFSEEPSPTGQPEPAPQDDLFKCTLVVDYSWSINAAREKDMDVPDMPDKEVRCWLVEDWLMLCRHVPTHRTQAAHVGICMSMYVLC
jgi:hypothetical protein